VYGAIPRLIDVYNECGISLPDSWFSWLIRDRFQGYSAPNETRRRFCVIDLKITDKEAINDYNNKYHGIRYSD
jgi:hypothetical protein